MNKERNIIISKIDQSTHTLLFTIFSSSVYLLLEKIIMNS